MGAVESTTTRYQGTPPRHSRYQFDQYDDDDYHQGARWFDADDDYASEHSEHGRQRHGVTVGLQSVLSDSFQYSGDEQDFHSVSGDSAGTNSSFITAEGTPGSFLSARSPLAASVSGPQSRRKRTKDRSSRSRRRKLSVSFHGLTPDTGATETRNTPRENDDASSTIEVVIDDDTYGGPSPRKLRFSLADGFMTKERLEALSEEVEKAARRADAAIDDHDHDTKENHVQNKFPAMSGGNEATHEGFSPPLYQNGINENGEEEDFIDANFSVPHRRSGKGDRSSKKRRGRSSIGLKLASLAASDGSCQECGAAAEQCGCAKKHVTTFDSFDELNDLIRRGIEALEGSSKGGAAPSVSLDANDLRRLLLLAGHTREHIQEKAETAGANTQQQVDEPPSSPPPAKQQYQQPPQHLPPATPSKDEQCAVVTAQPTTRYRANTSATTPRASTQTPRNGRTPSRHRYKDTATYIEAFSVNPDYWAAPRESSGRQVQRHRTSENTPGRRKPRRSREHRRNAQSQTVGKENRSPQQTARQHKTTKPPTQPAGLVKPKMVTYTTPVAPAGSSITTRSKRKLQPPAIIETTPTSPDTRAAVELWGTPYIATTVRAKKRRE